jgi:hypothetical protein
MSFLRKIDFGWQADPKALQYVFQTSGYNFKKLDGLRAALALLVDRGIVWAEGEALHMPGCHVTQLIPGDVHKRHRKAMLPAFGTPETRAFLPIFTSVIEKIGSKWSDLIAADPSGKSRVIDIPSWLSRATLDA